jgi:hypothetical protein
MNIAVFNILNPQILSNSHKTGKVQTQFCPRGTSTAKLPSDEQKHTEAQ